jgi:hypothetical protein
MNRSLSSAVVNEAAAAINLLAAKAALTAAASELPDGHRAQAQIVEALCQVEGAIAKVEAA